MTHTAMECRAHAINCLKLAETETPQGRITLLAISQQWLRLAVDMENNDSFLKVMDYIDKTWEGTRVPEKTNGGRLLIPPELD
jgi:hypothetical protein